jgi:glycosyltransferase involved in cell wall biosynthesis
VDGTRVGAQNGKTDEVTTRRRRILLVNNSDVGSGAGRIAWSLLEGARARGHDVRYIVDISHTGSPDVALLSEARSAGRWRRPLLQLGDSLMPLVGRVRGARWIRTQLHRLAHPDRIRDHWRGVEQFSFPATWKLLDFMPPAPDLVHCHDLLGEYFDLRALPWLSGRVPVVLTLHNTWLFTGHCSHPLDCTRWMGGCGSCPDLRIYPPLRRDGTAGNWLRKAGIHNSSRLYVAAPCQWLMDMVEESMLKPAVRLSRVIPHGVDLTVFRPGDRESVRALLGIPTGTFVMMLTAAGGQHNTWKDLPTLTEAVGRVAEKLPGRDVELIIVGGHGADQWVNGARIRFLPFQADRAKMARYYQAADVYTHSTKADTFPTAVLEALACGTPVVATRVGGIPEQVRHLSLTQVGHSGSSEHRAGATGILVPPADAAEFAAAIRILAVDESLRSALGRNAADDAAVRFDNERQVSEYLAFYEAVIQDWKRHADG